MQLQDWRKKATKSAYQGAVIAASNRAMGEAGVLDMVDHLVTIPKIEAVCNWVLLALFDKTSNNPADKAVNPTLYGKVHRWLQGLPLDTMNYNHEIINWLVLEGLVHSNFVTGSVDGQWTAAGERHWDYLARTILTNASPHTIATLCKERT